MPCRADHTCLCTTAVHKHKNTLLQKIQLNCDCPDEMFVFSAHSVLQSSAGWTMLPHKARQLPPSYDPQEEELFFKACVVHNSVYCCTATTHDAPTTPLPPEHPHKYADTKPHPPELHSTHT